MNQSYIPDIEFIKERSFESSDNVFKIKADKLFGRLFGDSEYIPLDFQLKYQNNNIVITKEKTDNYNGQLVISYSNLELNISIFVYL